jgi:hypothetical protein
LTYLYPVFFTAAALHRSKQIPIQLKGKIELG